MKHYETNHEEDNGYLTPSTQEGNVRELYKDCRSCQPVKRVSQG